ncbi:nucleotidyl transferase AbiEii/AbiGii toxin family protein [Xanthomonas arboricola]|uniref:nucleotidyl transferase AbiEii/AbiGii toxin family protein n=1 Tax=Xanthomonas arboricola TaxID=56448 RepID=UPI000CEE5F21|nr:nucleotidyl transferase AbiEii/AbiGii toxin family protein [Xanthomonas arboricola]PPT46451.1 hypothetical protein XarjCFBP7652_17625 [Xanthomonas arboricola]
MKQRETRNVVASVLARLRSHAKANAAPFQQVLQHYAIERFLYRLSLSPHARSVVLKGALLLKTIDIPSARPTMDIDMLRQGRADTESLLALVRDCARLEVAPDGLSFLADSLQAETITKDAEYQGTRLLLDARMDNVRLRIQIDFGVGDVMVPGPRLIEYPAVLEGDTIQLLAYPVESAITEKLQAMVSLGDANSRMKDFYDVWTYSRHLNFAPETLLAAIVATFRNRATPIPTWEFEALTAHFAERHRVQWNAFVRKIGAVELADALGQVIQDLGHFLLPLLHAIAREERLPQHWVAGQGWRIAE